MRIHRWLLVLFPLLLAAGCLSEPEPITDETTQALDDGVREGCWLLYFEALDSCDKTHETYLTEVCNKHEDPAKKQRCTDFWDWVQRRCHGLAELNFDVCMLEDTTATTTE